MDVKQIAEQFHIVGKPEVIIPWGNGLINDTFRVKTSEGGDYLLQRLNTRAYHDLPGMMDNIQMVTEWVGRDDYYFSDGRKKPTLKLILGKNGARYVMGEGKDAWRMYNFMADTFSIEVVENEDQVYALGETLGRFQYRLRDFPVYQMHTTVPNFHNPLFHYEKLMKTVENDYLGRANQVEEEMYFIRRARRRLQFDCLDKEQKNGRLPLRANHNDPKINNILFDCKSGESIFMVDLDTIMPGLVAWDFGDAIRSCFCTGKDQVEGAGTFDEKLFLKYKEGFLDGTKGVLTRYEEQTLDMGAQLIVLESAMRYLEDYLSGNLYLKVKYPEQNLVKARIHMKLAEEMWQTLN